MNPIFVIIVMLLAVNTYGSISELGMICKENKFETIASFTSYGYYITSRTVIKEAKSGETYTQKRLFHDRYTGKYQIFDTTLLFKKRFIASLYVQGCDDHEWITNKAECTAMSYVPEESLEILEMGSVTFYDLYDGHNWIRYFKSELVGEGINTLSYLQGISPDYLWPNPFLDGSGVCAFWTSIKTFVYVMNAKPNENHVLWTRTALQISQNITWDRREIIGFADKEFTSLFYWSLDRKVLALVINKGEPKNSAVIYELNINSSDANNLFVKSKYLNPKELFKCNEYEIEESSSRILIICLMIVAILMLFITLLVFGYLIWILVKTD